MAKDVEILLLENMQTHTDTQKHNISGIIVKNAHGRDFNFLIYFPTATTTKELLARSDFKITAQSYRETCS